MENKELLLSLQKSLVKELCLQGLLTEEQTQIAIKEFEKNYETQIIKKEVEKK